MANKMEAMKAKAAAAGEMQQAKKSAIADKMKAAPKPVAKPAPKGDSFAKVKAAYANETNRINSAKAAGTYKTPEVRGMLGGGGGPPPSRPMGGMGSMGARAGVTRPSMGGMGMKKGGKAKGKK